MYLGTLLFFFLAETSANPERTSFCTLNKVGTMYGVGGGTLQVCVLIDSPTPVAFASHLGFKAMNRPQLVAR